VRVRVGEGVTSRRDRARAASRCVRIDNGRETNAMKNSSLHERGDRQRPRVWSFSGKVLRLAWHLRLELGQGPPGRRERGRREPHIIGSFGIVVYPTLVLRYDFPHTFLAGAALRQQQCRIRVYSPDGGIGSYRPADPTVVVCSAIEGGISNNAEDIASAVWNILQRPGHLTWIEHWWRQEHSPYPEFQCVQFHHDGYGTLHRPQWRVAERSDVEALVGPVETPTPPYAPGVSRVRPGAPPGPVGNGSTSARISHHKRRGRR
jgi:hypothetical protein